MTYQGSIHQLIASAIQDADSSYFFEDYTKQANAVLQSMTKHGYMVVPSEPTDTMITSGTNAISAGKIKPELLVKQIYTDMAKCGKREGAAR